MMIYLFDTNIIIYYLTQDKNPAISNYINSSLKPFESPNRSILSIVSAGEIKSIAYQRNWGEKKLKALDEFLDQFVIIDISSDDMVNKYAEIDAYSQGKLESKSMPEGSSAKNMGKNDLWIATLANLSEAVLVTTDKDFDHLDKEYIDLNYISVEEINNNIKQK